ncbi:hypothetical protein ED28_13965 [[Pantoea] beijingensis]|uniref:DNA-binding transcriptional regulator n=1 Tax=[Pantoea] beijingensis TaxID=1324864 RepID=A0A443IB71_9GAMM|nr:MULTISPECIES: YfeC-like transcriptional regulator [Erwiniaceae]RWR01240.1 hypothetical protein ED28_13965 [[Pantoea] beijingensis]
MKKEWLTPEEMAQATGYTRQTINKWIKRENWTTVPKPGVQGGKARMVHIDERVKDFLKSTCQAAEPSASYLVNSNPLPNLLLNAIQQMTPQEQDKLVTLLVREGIQGLLTRLDIGNE